MTVIVNSGTTLTVTNVSGLTINSDSTIASGGVLVGSGSVTGGFALLNLGTIMGNVPAGVLTVSTETLTNQGTIFANNASLAVQGSVALTNLSAGTLTGGVWQSAGTGTLALLSGSIVTDNATITLNGTGSALESGKGSVTTIESSLATIAASGVLNLLGGRNFGAANSLVVDGSLAIAGGTLSVTTSPGLVIGATGHVAGFGAIDPGTPVTDNGMIEAQGGALALPGVGNVSGGGTLQADTGASLVLQALGSYPESIVNNGTIDAAFGGITGTLGISGAYSGNGGFVIEGGFDSSDRTILELPSDVLANVAFDANFGELLLDDASGFNGTVSGFGNSDTIVMPSIANAQTATLNGSILDLTDSGGSFVQALRLNTASMDYSAAQFIVTENAGDSQATVKVSGVQAAACFAAGTRIRTRIGDVPVESLAVGDTLPTHFAGNATIVWIGHRHIDCRRHPDPSRVWPVRVSAHAFGPRMPDRDLVLSPDHAVFVDGVLIPIKQLLNGNTIAQETVDTVTYFHVELGEHDVLLAEGMPGKSYLEIGDRAAFDNAGGVVALHPDFAVRRWEAFGCAPLVLTGATVDAVAARLQGRMPKRPRAGRVRHSA